MTIGWTNQAQYTFNVKILFWIDIDKTKLEYSTERMLRGKKGASDSTYLFHFLPSWIILADNFFEARIACDAFKQWNEDIFTGGFPRRRWEPENKKKRDLKNNKDLASLCRLTAHAGMKLAISQTGKGEQMKLNEKNSSDMKVLILCKTKED